MPEGNIQVKKISEWLGLGGTCKTMSFQPSCHWEGHLPLEQVTLLAFNVSVFSLSSLRKTFEFSSVCVGAGLGLGEGN